MALLAAGFPLSSQVFKKRTDSAPENPWLSPSPFSFVYGGIPSAKLLTQWPQRRTSGRLANGGQQTVVIWTDPLSQLQVRWVTTEYPGVPVVDWTVYLSNAGSSRTHVISDLLPLDLSITPIKTPGWVVHTNNGSTAQPTDFAPYEVPLEANTFRLFSTMGGRPSNGYHNSDLGATNIGGGWPYFNIDWGSGGLIVALGWPGQWALQAERVGQHRLRLLGGMSQLDGGSLTPGLDIFHTDLTQLWLEPGESIRTPRIVVLPWGTVEDVTHAGTNWVEAQNIWRGWFVRHHMPRPNHVLPKPICAAAANGFFAEQGGPDGPDNQANELSWIDAYGEEHETADTGGVHNYWWIDAGWYETPPGPITWVSVGTWKPSPTRFPEGLAPVFDQARRLGMGAILWFEPVRVMPGTWLYEHRQNWLLSPPPGFPEYSGQARLFNFGDPEARAWAINHFSQLITTQKVDVYREDYNIDPLAYWQFSDPPGRRGLTQIRFVEGYLAYWKALLTQHPGLLIDSCASGGRRLDIETMGLAVNLWRSDYSNVATANQSMQHGVSSWLPMTGDMVEVQSFSQSGVNAYNARSAMAPAFQEIVQVPQAVTENWTALREMSFEWLDISDAYYGDYYPLTKYSIAHDVWMAWQFHLSAANRGFIQVFRRSESQVAEMVLNLYGLKSSSRYRLFDYATHASWTAQGSELASRGLRVRLPEVSSATTIRYSSL